MQTNPHGLYDTNLCLMHTIEVGVGWGSFWTLTVVGSLSVQCIFRRVQLTPMACNNRKQEWVLAS